MSNVSFPAAHLSSYDIGHRIQVITVDGAKITDTLTRITTFQQEEDHVVLYLAFENVAPNTECECCAEEGFLVDLQQMVKRIVK